MFAKGFFPVHQFAIGSILFERCFLAKEIKIEQEPAEDDEKWIDNRKDRDTHIDISKGNEDNVDWY